MKVKLKRTYFLNGTRYRKGVVTMPDTCQWSVLNEKTGKRTLKTVSTEDYLPADAEILDDDAEPEAPAKPEPVALSELAKDKGKASKTLVS